MEHLNNTETSAPLILLTGATGYIGGRLVKALEGHGHRLRCLVRRPDFLRPRVAEMTEVVQGDLLNSDSLRPALVGVHTAYYLVHSMGSSGAFEEEDRRAAQNFGEPFCRITFFPSGEWQFPANESRHSSKPISMWREKPFLIFSTSAASNASG